MSAGRVSRVLKRALRWALWAGSLGGAVLASSCGEKDVVVATLPAATERGPASGCSTNDDCLSTEFCARESCSDTYGTCELPSPICDDSGSPVCGCDGVSYWNDCLRKQYGTTASVPGSCTTNAATCMADNAFDCPFVGAACAKLLPPGAACDTATTGACWVLPVACPPMPSPDRYTSCFGPMDCQDTCGAIRQGTPFRKATMQCQFGPPGR